MGISEPTTHIGVVGGIKSAVFLRIEKNHNARNMGVLTNRISNMIFISNRYSIIYNL